MPPAVARLRTCGGNRFSRRPQLVVRHVREDVLPEREHHALGLEHAEGPRDEPHVKVGATVSPSVEVHARDVAEREDRPLDAGHDRPERGGHVVGQVREGVGVHPAGEPDRTGEAAADGRVQRPVLVFPHRARRLARADPALLAPGLSSPWRLGDHARAERSDHERIVIGQRHVSSFGRSSARSSAHSSWPPGAYAKKRSIHHTSTVTRPNPSACRRATSEPASIGL